MKTKNPGKQRKRLHAPGTHYKRKLMAAALSKELRAQYKKRSIPARKGDEVEILVGKFRKIKGVVTKVNVSKSRLYIEGASVKKVGGTQAQVPISPSNVRITKLVEDKYRQRVFRRKATEMKGA
ncbi:MAG: 50S ribosomal protein L24 [Candidatus Aenigmatarchaeota archaeon]